MNLQKQIVEKQEDEKRQMSKFFCVHCRGSSESKHTTHNKMGGRRKDKTVGSREIRRSVEGRGIGVGNKVYSRWTLQELSGPYMTGTFRKESSGNMKEVGLGWINGGRKDRGFGWGKIRGGGEQLF